MANLDDALRLQGRYERLDARARRVCSNMDLLWVKGKLVETRRLMEGMARFVLTGAKMMQALNRDIQRVMLKYEERRKP